MFLFDILNLHPICCLYIEGSIHADTHNSHGSISIEIKMPSSNLIVLIMTHINIPGQTLEVVKSFIIT